MIVYGAVRVELKESVLKKRFEARGLRSLLVDDVCRRQTQE
jgi:hypothetical protein